MANPTGSQSFDISGSSYRLSGTITWSISGSTVTWTMNYTTYEWVIRMGTSGNHYWGFQGLTNSAVRLYVGSSYVENTNQYSGYPYGTHANKSENAWQQVKTGTLTTTSSVSTSTVSVQPVIVVPNVRTTQSYILGWSVSYDGNGSTSGSTSAQTKVIDTNLTLRSNGFTRTNYTFLRWNTKADGTGTNYDAGAIYTADSAVTLYAQWKKNNIPVYTNLNGEIKQFEKVWANVNGEIKECTVYVNVNGTIYHLI